MSFSPASHTFNLCNGEVSKKPFNMQICFTLESLHIYRIRTG